MVALKKVCKTPLNLKIISFFYQYPQTMDTSWNIAAWLNLERGKLKKALDYLVRQKVLTTHRLGTTTVYAFTQDKKIIDEIESVLQKDRNKEEGNV